MARRFVEWDSWEAGLCDEPLWSEEHEEWYIVLLLKAMEYLPLLVRGGKAEVLTVHRWGVRG
jgi:hypothetical protein